MKLGETVALAIVLAFSLAIAAGLPWMWALIALAAFIGAES